MSSYNYGNLAEKPVKQEQTAAHTVRHTGTALSGTRVHVDRKLRLRCLLLGSVVALMCLFTIFCSNIAAQKGYELVKMRQSVSTLQKENARLKLDIAKLKSPDRIKTIAVKQLGMILPPKIYFANQNH